MHEPRSISIRVESESNTIELGRRLAAILSCGTTITLSGTLGAGKTRFVKGVAAGMGIDPELVVSPTFSIANQYAGRLTINHLDVYRIADSDEFLELGVEELFDSQAVTLIEWGERFPACLPDDFLEVNISVLDVDSREVTIIPHGTLMSDLYPQLQKLIDQWRITFST